MLFRSIPDQVHILNVSFLVPAMRREFGGCAGNIAYNLKLLGEIVARKVLTPSQLGIHQAALPAEGELHVHARLQVGTLPASGFQADLFYP